MKRFFIAAALLAALPCIPFAASVVLGPGQTQTGGLSLSGTDSLIVNGTAQNMATISGGTVTTAAGWTGQVRVNYCTFTNVSSVTITATSGTVLISHCVFDHSGRITAALNGTSTINFQFNDLKDNGTVSVTETRFPEDFGIELKGTSTALKKYQGNNMFHGVLHLTGTTNWLIGGDADSLGNVHICPRGGMVVDGCQNITIRGNYFYCFVPSRAWSQPTTLDLSGLNNSLIEHNVIRGSAWTVRGAACEVRYNLIQDPDGHSPIHSPQSGARIHHNVVTYHTNSIGGGYYGEETIYMSETAQNPGVEIYNNTFDMGGSTLPMPMRHPFVKYTAGSAGFLKSCRSNIISHLPFPGPAFMLQEYGTWPDSVYPGIGYEDYNCWYNPEATGHIIGVYESTTVKVPGKTYRADAGFGYNDLPVGGAPDVQVDPKFAAAKPDANVDPLYYPRDTTDAMIRKIKVRQITVSQILRAYRAYYILQSTSPCIDAGDPADGAGTDIGALDGGVQTGLDLFGKFGEPVQIEGKVKAEGIQLEATPNPFKTAVNITYHVGAIHESHPRLAIYNTAGKCVAQLVARYSLPVASYSWNASQMNSGLYIARLTVGNTVISKRLMLVK